MVSLSTRSVVRCAPFTGLRWLCAVLAWASLASCGDPSMGPPRSVDLGGPGGFTQQAVFDPWLLAIDAHSQTFNFYLYVPDDYAPSRAAYPLLLALHGDNGDRTYLAGPTPAELSFGPLEPLYVSDTTLDPGGRSRLNPHVRGSFVVYPKVPRIDETFMSRLGYWNPDALDQIIDYVAARYRIDANRLYVTGPSMGGGGTFHYARSRPGRASAIVPICNGLYQGQGAEQLRGLPIWLFHSFDDTTVPYRTDINPTLEALMPGVADVMEGYPFTNGSQAANDDYTVSYDPLRGRGPWQPGTAFPTGLITYTLYRSGGHDAWTRTYANDDMWAWLYAQKKS
jgi:predicted peptidase